MSNIDFIRNKVNGVIKNFDTRDPFDICKYMNIRIYYKDLGNTLKAYYFYQSRIKNIVINSRSYSDIRKVLCAHELGHAVQHGKIATMKGFHEMRLFDTTVPAEYEANLFAADLIISDEEIMELLCDRDKSFFSMAKELYVPAEPIF